VTGGGFWIARILKYNTEIESVSLFCIKNDKECTDVIVTYEKGIAHHFSVFQLTTPDVDIHKKYREATEEEVMEISNHVAALYEKMKANILNCKVEE